MLHDDSSYYVLYTDKECKELHEPEEDVKGDTHLYAEIESYEDYEGAEDEVWGVWEYLSGNNISQNNTMDLQFVSFSVVSWQNYWKNLWLFYNDDNKWEYSKWKSRK